MPRKDSPVPMANLLDRRHGSLLPVALTGLVVDARIDGAMSEIRVAQSYRNAEKEPIEAVYTFPLPLDAVLLDIAVDIGDRRLRGTIQPLDQARDTYEDAIEGGDGAFMLEQTQPGLFTLSAGNLRPGESACVSFAYAILNRWSGDRLRFLLPTTIAPRYGDWTIAPQAVPHADLFSENRFALAIAVGPDLRDAAISCPSHRLGKRSPDMLVLADETAAMDRDFVLEIRHAQPRPSFALLGRAPDGIVALASFQPEMPGLAPRRAIDAVAVIDCSGSMAGGSIAQARKALHTVIGGLEAGDRLGMIAFGSTTRGLPGGRLAADRGGIAALTSFAHSLEADLGGTELARALPEAIAMARGGERPADIFLVTDGEIADWEQVVATAQASGLRVFVVGVGHAVSEAFLASLAEITGGACELVSPDERMAERVARHFERMRAPRASEIVFVWPAGATHLAPATPRAVYAGDTIHGFARLGATTAFGAVALEFSTEDGRRHSQRVGLAGPVAEGEGGRPSTIARLAAAARLAKLPAREATTLALQYQLLSPHTAWMVVDARDAAGKTDGAPKLRRVPHMLAAGWGGTGLAAVAAGPRVAAAPIILSDEPPPYAATMARPAVEYRNARTGAGTTRRQAIAHLLATTRGSPAPGQIAQAAGCARILEDLQRETRSAFLSALVCAAFEFGFLEAFDHDDPRAASLCADLEAAVARGVARLRDAGAQLSAADPSHAGPLPAEGSAPPDIGMPVHEALQMVIRAAALGRLQAGILDG